jgi:C1A family cysteine protease
MIAKGENNLMRAVVYRPVASALDASVDLKKYTTGIFDKSCTTTLNHAIAVVGYESNYFKVKNSWGTGWGEAGYVRLAANTGSNGDGKCGVAREASYPSL